MERSTIHLLAKRGRSIRQIATELGRSPTTISRVLQGPVERQPAKRYRRSKVDPYRAQIAGWLGEGLTAERMLELARADAAQPYRGGQSVFRGYVRRVRLEQQQQQATSDVPIRFEGLPGEYLQVDWGEIRAFLFTQQPTATRYFLACRLKYSRWTWVRFTADMRQETLFRGLVDCFLALGWVPWVLVFDNMKTVTSGRDHAGQPVWTPALAQLAGECGFHPQACDPGAGNQKGSVESLVKWVKSNLLPGRRFADDADLAAQTVDWLGYANTRPSAATGAPPLARLPAEAATGGPLPPTAADYGLLASGLVSAEALVAVAGNRYSVPVAHVGAPVTVRVHRDRVRIWRDAACLADHPRAPEGARRRVIDPAHFAPLFPQKRRAQAMLYREVLLGLGGRAPAFIGELSRRQRDLCWPRSPSVLALPLSGAPCRCSWLTSERLHSGSLTVVPCRRRRSCVALARPLQRPRTLGWQAAQAVRRHPLSILRRSVTRPRRTAAERVLLVLLASRARTWCRDLVIVQPRAGRLPHVLAG